MSRSYQRPENALKRANEFIDVGKPSRALEVLYEVIRRGKMRTNCSEKLLEPIMVKYLELCVDLKKSHLAKEGLYQYRNIFQSVNVSSLETVVKFYLRLADEKTESARKESHQAVVDIDDLDNLATPEEILLSAVSGEDAQDRSDRTILTPWVKFLWESYRQCLELLRTNSRVEKLYHNIAQHAFKFCEKYTRKMEFRKLCDNLRLHLTLIQKQQGSATAVNLNNPETQQLNLETRLEQLNYSIKMELWQEAYKAIEDISDLMKKSKKMTRPHVMASYYEKLALVFWKAGNYLFHAATLFKLFQLLRDQKKNITSEELSRRASVVLVSTLAIPLPSNHPEFDRFIETEKSSLEKVDRLANLLSLSKPPTRKTLIRDLNRLNVISSVPNELQDMFQLMEMEFDPLHLCKRMQVYLNWIKDHSEVGLPQYIPALQEMTITRLVKQVGQVYQTITYQRLLELSLFLTPFHLEKILVELVRHNDLQIRIDHRTNCVHFGMDLSESQREDLPEGPMLQALPSETIRCQLVHMSAAMHRCLSLISPESKKREMEPVRAQTIHLYNQTRAQEHEKMLARQNIIEERKEMLESQNLEREEQLRRAHEEVLKRQKEEEQDRLRREAHKRERERQEEQLKQIHTKQIKDKLLQISKTSYGQKMIEKIDKEELLNLGADEILQRQVEELEKERREQQKKLKAQEKNIDFYERARRILEVPRLKKQLEAQKEKDKEFWKVQEEERITRLVKEHEVALTHSKRLQIMNADRQEFVARLKAARHSEIEKKLNDFNTRVEVERKKRLQERKEQRRQERRDLYYKQKEEEEQLRRDEEIKRLKEDEARKEVERLKQAEDEEDEREARRKSDFDRFSERRQDLRSKDAVTQNGEVGKDTPEPWKPKRISAWRQKEEEKVNSWRPKGDSSEPLSERLMSKDIRQERTASPSRKDERDWRGGSTLKDADNQWNRQDGIGKGYQRDREVEGGRDVDRNFGREISRDQNKDFGRGPLRDQDKNFASESQRNQDREFIRKPPRDQDKDYGRRGPRDQDQDYGRGPRRDQDRDQDFVRKPLREKDYDKERDFEKGTPQDRDRDLERGSQRDRRAIPKDRDFERGTPRDRDRDFERGTPRDRDRDFERGTPRDRDFERGTPRDRDRGFERSTPIDRDRDIERGSQRDRRGPPRDRDSDFNRGPPRDRRGYDDYRKDDTPRKGFGGGGASWRNERSGDDSTDNWRQQRIDDSSKGFERDSPKVVRGPSGDQPGGTGRSAKQETDRKEVKRISKDEPEEDGWTKVSNRR